MDLRASQHDARSAEGEGIDPSRVNVARGSNPVRGPPRHLPNAVPTYPAHIKRLVSSLHGVYGQLNGAAHHGFEPRPTGTKDRRAAVTPMSIDQLPRAGGLEPPTRFGLCELYLFELRHGSLIVLLDAKPDSPGIRSGWAG